MKKIVIIIVLLLFINTLFAQSFHRLNFKTETGDSVSLSRFAGKKVLVIIVPLSPQDSVFRDLQAFKNRYRDSIQIIAVPSIENGFQKSHGAALQARCHEMNVLLTAGMYTQKASGASQSELLSWLTEKGRNTHFNDDVKGPGQKFFISETGRLYAVLPPQASLSHPIMDRIVHAHP